VNFGQGKVDFQTLVVGGQVNFNYWIEELKIHFKLFQKLIQMKNQPFI
jgi:hypothetical protein